MKTFKLCARNQLLLPPSLRDWLPEGALTLFMSDVVDGPGPAGIVAKDAVHNSVVSVAGLCKAAH